MVHTGSVAEVQDKKRLANHRNPLEEFSICPVYTGMNLRATLFAASLTDSPRIHGDTLAALAGNQRILASDKANCQIETLWRGV